ncbi:MAG: ATP-binding protein [bacterium]
MLCYLFPEPLYLIFSSSVPALLYYAYIPITILALVFSFYIFLKGQFYILNRLFFAICVFFSLWTVISLIEWTNIHSSFMLFVWSFSGIILSTIAILCIYFIYVFIEKKDVSNKIKKIFLILLAPVFILTPTALNVSGFNITSCDAFQFEYLPFKFYYILLSVISFFWILILLIRKYRKADSVFKKQILYMGVGIELFMISFFGIVFVVQYLTKLGLLSDSGLEIYGQFGMMVFLIYMAVLIVRYQFFNVKLFAAQAFIWGLVAIIGSQFFFIKVRTNFILNGIGFLIAILLGRLLIKSVKQEIEQKDKLEQLRLKLEESNLGLANANEKLKSLDKLKSEFLSLAAHQLRSPLTAIKGYSSMLDEGSYGKLAEGQDEAVRRIYASAQGLINIVEDLLNISKIEQGGMVYSFSPIELGTIVTAVFNEMQIPAQNKSLELRLDMSKTDKFMVVADATKIRQIVLNLIDNAIKYTPKGFVAVHLTKKADKVVFAVSDSGVGISPETKDKLFQKFSRGEGGKLNTGGSGLGLYLAKQIAAAHKGDVVIESEGLGKGSTFSLVLPMAGSQTTDFNVPS